MIIITAYYKLYNIVFATTQFIFISHLLKTLQTQSQIFQRRVCFNKSSVYRTFQPTLSVTVVFEVSLFVDTISQYVIASVTDTKSNFSK